MTLTAQKQSLHDEMVTYLREHDEGASSSSLALKFLKLKNAPAKIADGAITAILANDRRVSTDENGLWHAARTLAGNGLAGPDGALNNLPFSAVYCLIDPQSNRLLHFSAWDLFPSPSCTHAAWLVDPKLLPYDEGELLTSASDAPFDADRSTLTVTSFARAAEERIPVFLSSNHRKMMASLCAEGGANLPDDTMLLRGLLKAADITVPRSLDLVFAEKTVLGTEGRGEAAHKCGERFSDVLFELFELLKRKGIETRAALDACLPQEIAQLFIGKKISYNDILALPAAPGVYAFKDIDGRHCYIGKANNLKRRLQSYWKDSDESPDKIAQIREKTDALVTYRCGSELESLLYEYRLIRKYAPPLNNKVAIVERKGVFRPLEDCIVLLPHAEKGKGMSVWFRKNQKILLKPFDATFPAETDFTTELDAFFFTPVLKAEPTDFPEQEIASRWIKQHADSLAMLQVHNMANAAELYAAVKVLWREFSESGSVY
jgi:hypothetical protein